MSAEDTRQMLLRDFEYNRTVNGNTGYSHVLASAKGAGGFWILREVEYTDYLGVKIPKHVTATFIKMSSAAGMTYYKEIDIDCGPCYYSCPKSWLDRIQPQCSTGEEWLETAKSHHESKPKVVRGMQIEFRGVILTVVEYYGEGSDRATQGESLPHEIGSSNRQRKSKSKSPNSETLD